VTVGLLALTGLTAATVDIHLDGGGGTVFALMPELAGLDGAFDAR